MENNIFIMTVHKKLRIFFLQKKNLRKFTLRQKKKKRVNNYVKVTNGNESACSNIKTFGGARGVMVIVVGNEYGDTSSNPFS